MIEQGKFAYSPLGKALEKQRITRKIKQFVALEVLKPNTQQSTTKYVIPDVTLSEEAKNELTKIKEI